MTIREQVFSMKEAAPELAFSSGESRNRALLAAKKALGEKKDEIFAANLADREDARKNGVSEQIIKRLLFDDKKLKDVQEGISQLVDMPDPIGKIKLARQLDEGLVLEQVTCPIGVIGVIFEARPDALVQISSLCLKSGNAVVLKGGKETARTNQVLFDIIHEAAVSAGLPARCMMLATSHSEIDELLGCSGAVDLIIPRGSNKFVQYIMSHTVIPVMGHADGVCHIYVDDSDVPGAMDLIVDAKTQYPVACNAVETLLVRRCLAADFLPALRERMDREGVKLRGSREAAGILGCEVMDDEEFHKEYGDLILSVKVVEDVKEAADHINRYGSHHTDSIITGSDENAAYFMGMVDSAGVYRNCSTRFADGFRYGFGAEVGISTGKLHARGPVGLDGLLTYKYRLTGEGHIVADYAQGRRAFHFKDL